MEYPTTDRHVPPDISSSEADRISPRALVNLAQRPLVTSQEWEHLRFRVVALESLVIALLSDHSASRLDRAREMARHVAPRAGCSEHPVSLFAASQIIHLVERARRYKGQPLY